MISKYLVYEGERVHYKVGGKGEPLFLLHGFQSDSGIWDYLIPYLESCFTLIVPDLPGHGRSPLIRRNNDMGFLADIIFRITLSLGFKGVSVAGHSMGGYVALYYADKFPNYTDNLVLINSHPFEDSLTKVLAREREAVIIENEKGHMLLRNFIQNNFSQHFREFHKAKIREFTEIALRQPEDGMLADLAGMMARTDKTAVVKKVRNKIPVILGKEDKLISQDMFREVSERFELHLIMDCGHMGVMEQPEKLALTIKKIL